MNIVRLILKTAFKGLQNSDIEGFHHLFDAAVMAGLYRAISQRQSATSRQENPFPCVDQKTGVRGLRCAENKSFAFVSSTFKRREAMGLLRLSGSASQATCWRP